nr:hypothetical protein [Candidatus Sigynarchaeota archaeon]
MSSVWTDGTFVCTTGSMYNHSTDTRERVLVKWDANGNQLWNNTWDPAVNEDITWYGDEVSVWSDVVGNVYTSSSIPFVCSPVATTSLMHSSKKKLWPR